MPPLKSTLVGNTGSAVWEVLNTNPNTPESFTFNVFITYTASNVAHEYPAAECCRELPSVTLSYAPTATSGAASASLPIPRFALSSAATGSIFTIRSAVRSYCIRTSPTRPASTPVSQLRTPRSDPYGTGLQNGNCKLNWYGGTTAAPTTPPGPSDTGNIAAGTVWVNTPQTIAPNFQGYMIAECNFQYAHGFAFISDVGARNLAMGYLAIVIPDPSFTSRVPAHLRRTVRARIAASKTLTKQEAVDLTQGGSFGSPLFLSQ